MTARSTLGFLGASALFVGIASAAQAQPVRYVVEPTHTFANFEVRHFNTSTVRARFDKTDGFVVLDRGARSGQADITIDTASVSSGIPPFDAHLKKADFLDVAKFPKARFAGSQFSFDGDKVTAVAGELTLLGKTAPLTLRANHYNCYDSPRLKKQVCGGDFEATIRRSQWGMNWGIDMGIPDEVRLVIQIEVVAQ